jgi:hypothetical protein
MKKFKNFAGLTRAQNRELSFLYYYVQSLPKATKKVWKTITDSGSYLNEVIYEGVLDE